MGDEEDGLARGLSDGVELFLKGDAGLGVNRGERLIHQHHLGVGSQSARHRHPLLHATGELMGILPLESTQPHQLDKTPNDSGSLFFRYALNFQAMGDVLLHRTPRHDGELLKDHAAIRSRSGYFTAVEQYRPACFWEEPSQYVQQGCLAASAWADHRQKLPIFYLEINTVQRHHALSGERIDVLVPQSPNRNFRRHIVRFLLLSVRQNDFRKIYPAKPPSTQRKTHCHFDRREKSFSYRSQSLVMTGAGHALHE